MAGLQIDLDKGEGLIIKGKVADAVISPCTRLEVEFTCPELLEFRMDPTCYLKFLNLEWVPIRNQFSNTSQNTWWYKMEAFPRQGFATVDKPCTDIMSLASLLGLVLTEGSENFKVKCPVVGLPAYAFVRKARLQSFNDACIEGQMGNSKFVYFNSTSMTAMSWKSMMSQKVASLDIEAPLSGQEEISIIDNRIASWLESPMSPRAWEEEDFLNRMTGMIYKFRTPRAALFAVPYTMKFSNTSKADAPVPMLCYKTEMELGDKNMMSNYFAQVSFV